MNETHDPLEMELHGLRPHEPSPELRQRIEEQLNSAVPLRWRRRWRSLVWSASLAGGLAAAWLVVAILLRREGDVVIEPDPPREAPPSLLASAFDDSLPTVGTYHRALARSPDELDAVLDRHTVIRPEPDAQVWHVRAFTRLDNELDTLPGEF